MGTLSCAGILLIRNGVPMHAKVSIRRGVASTLLLAIALVAPVVDTASTANAVGAPRAEGSSNGPGGGRLVFTRFDPAIEDDATFIRQSNGAVRRLFPGGSSGPHWSPDGELVSIAACADPPACQTAAVLVDPDTGEFTALPMPAPARLFTSCLIWRPDGKRLACEGLGETDPSLTGVYTISVKGGDLRRVTRNPGGDDLPLDYSDDGTRLLFSRTNPARPEDTNSALFVKNLRSGKAHRITPWGFSDDQADWSSRGGQIAFEHEASLYLAHPNGDPVQKVPLDAVEGYGAGDFSWSPNGKRLAFLLLTPNTDGTYREGIATASATGSHVRWVTTSPTFDHQPNWRP
jgi:Tol biopolymer transport system component